MITILPYIEIKENQLFFRTSFLLEFGITEKMIDQIVHNYMYNTSLDDFDRLGFFIYDSLYLNYLFLSNELILKYKIPTEEALIKRYNKEFKEKKILDEKIKKQRKKEKLIRNAKKQHDNEEYIAMKFAIYHKRWKEYIFIYDKEFVDGQEIEKYCKTHVLLKTAVSLREEKKKLIDIYNCYKNYSNLVFAPKSYTAFANKLKEIYSENSIQDNLLHKLRNRVSNNFKLKDDVILIIKKYFCDPKKLNDQQILEKVNEYLIGVNRKTISLSSVQKVISSTFIQNECMIKRFGKKYVKDNLLPHSFFNPPEENGILWAMDGTRLQFIYKNKKKKYNFLSFFVVMDVYSKKVVGYSFGETENTQMVLDALIMACADTKYIPLEIIHDNSTAFNSKRILELKAYSKILGTEWRSIYVGNSRDNGTLERFFGIFQEKYCKKCNGYLGDGIKSRNLNGKPAPEEIKKHTTKLENIRTKDELIDLITLLIDQYNSRRNKGNSPNELSLNKISKKIIKINTIKFYKLFYPVKEITIRRSTVILNHHNIEYLYNFYKDEDVLKLHNTKVKVRYNPDNMNIILLFDINTDKYLTTIKRINRIPKVKIERTQKDNNDLYKHVQKLKNLEELLVNRTNEIINEADKYLENIPPEITEIIPSKKDETTANSDKSIENDIKEANKEREEKNRKKIVFENLYTQKGSLKIVS